MARIIPVIDVLGGRVVRAIGGRRSEYRPIRSQLTDSTDPVEVARDLVSVCEAGELYVADLDSITGTGPATNWDPLAEHLSVDVWADYGLRAMGWPNGVDPKPHVRPIVGTETATGTMTLRTTEIRHNRFGREQLIASLDLSGGHFLGDWSTWHMSSPTDWAGFAGTVSAFTRSLIVLDLTRVGTASGAGSEQVCRDLKRAHPGLSITVGGGVRDWDDVKRLEDAGADAVLVASALHDGTLTFPRPLG